MFGKQARFWVGEFDGEKECAAGNEVSAITRHRIFVCGLGVGEGMVCFLRFNFVETTSRDLCKIPFSRQPKSN